MYIFLQRSLAHCRLLPFSINSLIFAAVTSCPVTAAAKDFLLQGKPATFGSITYDTNSAPPVLNWTFTDLRAVKNSTRSGSVSMQFPPMAYSGSGNKICEVRGEIAELNFLAAVQDLQAGCKLISGGASDVTVSADVSVIVAGGKIQANFDNPCSYTLESAKTRASLFGKQTELQCLEGAALKVPPPVKPIETPPKVPVETVPDANPLECISQTSPPFTEVVTVTLFGVTESCERHFQEICAPNVITGECDCAVYTTGQGSCTSVESYP